MGIQFAVHTYGSFDVMFYVLNGIKMIMDSDFASSMIKLIALIATGYYSLKGMAEANNGGVGQYLLKTAGMLLLISTLLTPKADMIVVDRISGKREVVSGLPYAFVLPVGILEAIGAGITSLFEQAFTPVSSMAYKDYGLIFGARLVQESKDWRINNPEFAYNMNIFLKRCVVLESMIGRRFTPEDLFASTDMFRLVTENAGTFRLVDFRVNKKLERLSCKDAGGILKTYLKPEVDFLNFKYKGSDFGLAGSDGNLEINGLLNKNLEVGYASSLGVKGSAAEIIRQNMMINSLKDLGNISDRYAYTRADELQKSNWKIAGELAKKYLPMMLNITKALIYSCFIFIVPLMILSGGVTHYLKYCTVVFSLQIWPALNAVLNLFVELYSSSSIASITGGALTFDNFNRVHESVDAIVLVASGLQMSIPFLSFAIVQGGVGSFVHLASTLQGASNSAAATASGEVTSGSRSFDNINRDTASIGNKSGFKTDFNQLHQEGASQIQGAGGSIIKSFADGSSSITSGAGVNTSSGARGLFLENAKSNSLSEGYTQGLSQVQGLEQHFQQSKTAAISSATDRISHLAQKQAAGETLNIDNTTEEGKAMQQAVNNAVALHDRDGYGWSQAAKASVNAYADAGIKVPNAMPLVKGEAGVRIDGGVSAENNSNQSLDKQNSVTRENNTSNNLNTLLRAASNEHYSKDDSIDQSLANSTKASYDQMQSYGKTLSQKREEVENYSSAMQSAQHKSATDRRDMTHEVEDKVMKQYGVSREDAHQMVQGADPRAERVWNSMVQTETERELAQVRASKNLIEGNASRNSVQFENEHSGKVTNQGQLDLQKQAASEGLDANLMQAKINQTHDKVENKQKDMTENANNQIHSVEHHNKVMEQGMNKKIGEYEKDRIGQGITSKVVGTLAQVPTVGHAGGFNVGGMNSQQKAQEYLKGGEKAEQIHPAKPLKTKEEK